jgi:hypothetical protein
VNVRGGLDELEAVGEIDHVVRSDRAREHHHFSLVTLLDRFLVVGGGTPGRAPRRFCRSPTLSHVSRLRANHGPVPDFSNSSTRREGHLGPIALFRGDPKTPPELRPFDVADERLRGRRSPRVLGRPLGEAFDASRPEGAPRAVRMAAPRSLPRRSQAAMSSK